MSQNRGGNLIQVIQKPLEVVHPCTPSNTRARPIGKRGGVPPRLPTGQGSYPGSVCYQKCYQNAAGTAGSRVNLDSETATITAIRMVSKTCSHV